jgi:hypothetical protein
MSDLRMMLADPCGTMEMECGMRETKQADVALTYALALRDESLVAVDWARMNAAIRNRWPRGLNRVKEMAWKKIAELSR